MSEDSRKLRAQEIEAKREAALREREEKRKATGTQEKTDTAKRGVKTDSQKREESLSKKKPQQEKDKKHDARQKEKDDKITEDKGKDVKEKSAKDQHLSVEAKREAAIKEREAKRNGTLDDKTPQQAKGTAPDKSVKENAASPRSAPTTPTTAATTPADLQRGADTTTHLEQESKMQHTFVKHEIESAKRLLKSLERERDILDAARKRRENEVYKDQFHIDEGELETVRTEEREARRDIMRKEAEAHLRIEVAEDLEMEELERKRRIEVERNRLLQGGTLEEREAALKKLHELEEQKFNYLEASRLRAKSKQARKEEMEKRMLLVEKAETDPELWQRDRAQRESILQRISATEDARRLEEMLVKGMDDAQTTQNVFERLREEEMWEASESKSDAIMQNIIFNERREKLTQESFQGNLRSQKGRGYPKDKDGRLERRRRRWNTRQAMRPEDRLVDTWKTEWRKELEDDAMWRQDQRRILEVSTILEKKRPLVDEQIRLVSRRQQELARLTLLKALGSEATRCHTCDLNMANMRPLLRALRAILLEVYRLQSDAQGKRFGLDLLQIIATALQSTAHIDPKIAELASCMPKELEGHASTFLVLEATDLSEETPVPSVVKSGEKVRDALSPAPASNSSKDHSRQSNPMKEGRSPRKDVAPQEQQPKTQELGASKEAKERRAVSPEVKKEKESDSIEAKREAAIKAKERRAVSPEVKEEKEYDSIEAKREAAIKAKEERSAISPEIKKDSIEAKREAAIKEREMRQKNKNYSVAAKREAAIMKREARTNQKEARESIVVVSTSSRRLSERSIDGTLPSFGHAEATTRSESGDGVEAKREAAIAERERRRLEKESQQSKVEKTSQTKPKQKDGLKNATKESNRTDVEAKREAAIREREAKRKEKETT